MPNTKQAEKAVRQNNRRALRNKIIKSQIKTAIKKVRIAVDNNDKEKAKQLLKQAQAIIDKAYVKGVVHKNNAARKKSKLALLVNKISK